MKKTLKYLVNQKMVEREINYIPGRFIIAIFLALMATLAVMAIVVLLSMYVPYFYLLMWATEIACIIQIASSNDNPDYKVPWLLVVMIVPVAGMMLYIMFHSRTLQMTRTYYAALMDAGVQIYEYEPGFIHAKCYLSDDEYAMVGTINLDYRSLVHHFENGVWMYHAQCIPFIRKDFSETFAKSIHMDKSMLKKGLLQRLICALVKIFAPML